MGSTGEYSSYRMWHVTGYLNEDYANDHVKLAQARGNELFAIGDKFSAFEYQNFNEYDEHMKLDYTGVEYYYITVDVVSVSPKFKALLM